MDREALQHLYENIHEDRTKGGKDIAFVSVEGETVLRAKKALKDLLDTRPETRAEPVAWQWRRLNGGTWEHYSHGSREPEPSDTHEFRAVYAQPTQPDAVEALREVHEELGMAGCSCGCSGRKGRVLREIDTPPAVSVWLRKHGYVAVPCDLVDRLRALTTDEEGG